MFLKRDFLLFLVFHICHESYEQELKAFEMNVAIEDNHNIIDLFERKKSYEFSRRKLTLLYLLV